MEVQCIISNYRLNEYVKINPNKFLQTNTEYSSYIYICFSPIIISYCVAMYVYVIKASVYCIIMPYR